MPLATLSPVPTATCGAFTCNLQDLIDATTRVRSVMTGKPVHGVDAGIVVTVADQVAVSGGSYTAVAARTTLDADTQVTGRMVVCGPSLTGGLRALCSTIAIRDRKHTPVTLDADTRPGWVYLRAVGYGWPIQAIPADVYPDTLLAGLDPGDGPTARVLGLDTQSALRFATSAMGRDDTMPLLCGVHARVDGDRLILEGTDRYRFAHASTGVVADAGFQAFVIPATVIPALRRLEPGEWTVQQQPEDPGRVVVDDGTTKVSFVQVDGKYPDLTKLVKTSPGVVITLDRAGLLRMVKFARMVSGSTDPGQILVRDGTATFVPRVTADRGEDTPPTAETPTVACTVAEGVIGRDGVALSFNPRYLSDALAGFTSTRVAVRFTAPPWAGMPDPTKPILLASTPEDLRDGHARRLLLMPVRSATS